MSRVTPPSTASAGLCGHSQVHTSLDGSFQSSAAARTVSRAQVRAQAQLLSAVSCERALRWSEVVEHYTALLKTLSKEELPKDFEPGPYHSQLDAYCVRALVWSTLKEEKRALFDLNCSQKLKPLHISTLIIKGAIKNSLLATGDPESLMKNKDHEKAYKLDKDSKNFFDVKDFLSPKMADFYDSNPWAAHPSMMTQKKRSDSIAKLL
ncbi:uncharacterized protein LOC142023588 isoform X2 [Carettochelys insculpta]|uniref:uncharacterized protein LOC142023588 isoform X2 n=1 Tax=Carettochelys insculpta TaxID=44489 RepID=UPI003EB8B0C0